MTEASARHADEPASSGRSLRTLAKAALDVVALVLSWPAAALCQIEHALAPNSDGMFLFWAHVFAMLPGPPGVFLRRAFYRQTLQHCEREFYIGFGAYFTHRQARVEHGVYIGPYALVASVILRRNCLIGSRASLLSGGQLHLIDEQGNWGPADRSRMQQIEIGENAWLGEGSLAMANVGARAMVAAGAVVSTPVPERVMVAGNPARFVRKLSAAGAQQSVSASSSDEQQRGQK
jgi:virginiamycin A acetyltransferase